MNKALLDWLVTTVLIIIILALLALILFNTVDIFQILYNRFIAYRG